MYRNQIVGKYGEEMACDYLRGLGYQILKRNFFCKTGEIDIIAEDKSEVVFIEVKSRTSHLYGNGIEAIDNRKISRMRRAAEYYVFMKGMENRNIRFDAIEIDLFSENIKLKHNKNII